MRKIIFVMCVSLVSLFIPYTVLAKVLGACSNCHTMHNSWGGQPIDSDGPNEALLIGGSDPCVGCHSNTEDGETIKTIGETKIPIVLNTNVEPTKPLAGGNFYWMLKNDDDTLGHNVWAIDGIEQDDYLTTAPGAPASGGSCAICHDRVEYCYSCHTPQHHKEDHPNGSYNNVVGIGETEGCYYRFLGCLSTNERQGKGLPVFHISPAVKGIEEKNWEQNPSSTVHNEYAGQTSKPSIGDSYQSISDFCAGCHRDFYHSSFYDPLGGGSSPWHRHPVDTMFSEAAGEEYIYNTPNGTDFGPYNPLAPIARANIDNYNGVGASSIVTEDDQVQCLSCHRPHGSPYPDILRWDYATCQAGTENSDCGCFVCHTKKDE